MRLLEPVNGLKLSQGHLIMHLAFFISMIITDREGAYTSPELHANQNKLRMLAGAKVAAPKKTLIELTPDDLDEMKADQMQLYAMLMWVHFATVICQFGFLYSYHNGHSNCA